MMRTLSIYIISFLCILLQSAQADTGVPSFSLHKLGGSSTGKTLLVIGGIQGDEPGGFHAASILTTHYSISNGNVWIVPNLNFPSIIKRSRGVHGDLNRKFATINPEDPEFIVVERIKSIILDNQVDIVLNLHDGSGLFRHNYIDKLHGPHRWGQSIIIDQEKIDAEAYSQLAAIAEKVTVEVNDNIEDETYSYRVKNTKTSEGNVEMAKTLTYFSIRNGRPAFGVEASKMLSKAERVYYHLMVLEGFMKEMDIKFERNFALTAANVGQVINKNRNIAFYDNRIFMDMQDVRNRVNYFPIERSGDVDFWTKDPLIAVVEKQSEYDIYHGNERITTLVPEFFDYDNQPPSVGIEIDGTYRDVKMGDIISVAKSFKILPQHGYRVNAIGFSVPNAKTESGINIQHSDFSKRFSLNTNGNIFRVEFYKTEQQNKDKFAGMILIKFNSSESSPRIAEVSVANDPLSATSPLESR